MARVLRRLVLDAAPLIALLRDEPHAERIVAAIGSAPTSVSTVTLAEVTDVLERVHGWSPGIAGETVREVLAVAVDYVAPTPELAARAGSLRARHYRRRANAVSLVIASCSRQLRRTERSSRRIACWRVPRVVRGSTSSSCRAAARRDGAPGRTDRLRKIRPCPRRPTSRCAMRGMPRTSDCWRPGRSTSCSPAGSRRSAAAASRRCAAPWGEDVAQAVCERLWRELKAGKHRDGRLSVSRHRPLRDRLGLQRLVRAGLAARTSSSSSTARRPDETEARDRRRHARAVRRDAPARRRRGRRALYWRALEPARSPSGSTRSRTPSTRRSAGTRRS